MKNIILVLGKKLDPGAVITPVYKKRLDRAVELCRQTTSLVISRGDVNKTGTTEAEAGKKYLSENFGLENILPEEKALDTIGNCAFTKDIFIEKQEYSPIIVTSGYHMPRVMQIFSHIYGPDLNPVYLSSDSCMDDDELKKNLKIEEEKALATLKFFEEIGAEPGDHETVIRYLESNEGVFLRDYS